MELESGIASSSSSMSLLWIAGLFRIWKVALLKTVFVVSILKTVRVKVKGSQALGITLLQ